MSVSVLVDHVKELMATLEKLAKVGSIFVGVPEEKASRKSSEMNNATLAAIHELGSPSANIPARPFLKIGIAKAQKECVNILGIGAAKALTNFDAGDLVKAQDKAGLVAQNSVRGVFTSGELKPLAESTLKKKGKKTTPLIDTGSLRTSISYVVR